MDLTPALAAGRNQITVQVRFQSPNSRWYSGAGIYRKVWLKVCPAVYLPLDGTYVTMKKCQGGFRLSAETEIAGRDDVNVGCTYRLWKDDELVQELGWHAEEPVAGGEGFTGKANVSALILRASIRHTCISTARGSTTGRTSPCTGSPRRVSSAASPVNAC